jgi:hypothetical protein
MQLDQPACLLAVLELGGAGGRELLDGGCCLLEGAVLALIASTDRRLDGRRNNRPGIDPARVGMEPLAQGTEAALHGRSG